MATNGTAFMTFHKVAGNKGNYTCHGTVKQVTNRFNDIMRYLQHGGSRIIRPKTLAHRAADPRSNKRRIFSEENFSQEGRRWRDKETTADKSGEWNATWLKEGPGVRLGDARNRRKVTRQVAAISATRLTASPSAAKRLPTCNKCVPVTLERPAVRLHADPVAPAFPYRSLVGGCSSLAAFADRRRPSTSGTRTSADTVSPPFRRRFEVVCRRGRQCVIFAQPIVAGVVVAVCAVDRSTLVDRRRLLLLRHAANAADALHLVVDGLQQCAERSAGVNQRDGWSSTGQRSVFIFSDFFPIRAGDVGRRGVVVGLTEAAAAVEHFLVAGRRLRHRPAPGSATVDFTVVVFQPVSAAGQLHVVKVSRPGCCIGCSGRFAPTVLLVDAPSEEH
jgi:hypothetical protein